MTQVSLSTAHPAFDVYQYLPKADLSYLATERLAAMDTETEPVVGGQPPVLVVMCVAWPGCRQVHMVDWDLATEYLERVDAIKPGLEWTMYNSPFDIDATGGRNSACWRAQVDGRVSDMQQRMSLWLMREGLFHSEVGLAEATRRHCGVVLPKDDAVRMSYRRGVDLTAAQLKYAALDPVATLAVREAMPTQLATEQLNTWGAMALYDISQTGLARDEEYIATIGADLREKHLVEMDTVTAWGIWPTKVDGEETGMSGGTKELQALLRSFEKRYGVKFKRKRPVQPRHLEVAVSTGEEPEDDDEDDTGETVDESRPISTEKSDMLLPWVDAGLPIHPLLLAYKRQKHYAHLLSYLKDEFRSPYDGADHPHFSTMKKTGRTGASRPPVQQMPTGRPPVGFGPEDMLPNIRGMYIAPPGHAILAIDGSQLELVALAQANWSRFGHSKMRELINDGVDLHSWLGLEYIGAKMLNEDISLYDDKTRKLRRQQAKAANFGFPGGLGGAAFQSYALETYGVSFTLDECKRLKQLWLEAFPECVEHLRPLEDPTWVKRNIDRWLSEHPKVLVPGSKPSTLRQFEDQLMSNGFDDRQAWAAQKSVSSYYVRLYSGREKSNCLFTAACNQEFQGLTADAMKQVLWDSYMAELRMCNFIHDEILYLLLLSMADDRMVKAICDLFLNGLRKVMPDMHPKCEYALMLRWDKRAKELRGEDGSLLIWTPELADEIERLKKIHKVAA